MNRVGILAITITVMLLFGAANATIWFVDPSYPLSTIQAGLDSCSDHDTVIVGAGTYYENIIWPNTMGIDLISQSGPGYTIIDGGNASSVIIIEHETLPACSVTIRGFTIRNGNAYFGGGIYAQGTVCYLLENIITNNTAALGGGIYALPRMIHLGTIAHIHDNIISGNSALHGGGITCHGLMSQVLVVNITGNTITNNDAVYGGGGIYASYSVDGYINANTIAHNMASYGGGIFVLETPPGGIVTISNNIVNYNTATEHGGGIGNVLGGTLYDAVDSIMGNIIIGNCAGHGGGLSVRADYVYGNTICYNSALEDGGAIQINPIPTTLVRCNKITGNSAVNDMDGIYIRAWYSGDTVIIDSNNIYGNGYGLYNPDTTITVIAEYNWWGDAAGPYHPTLNPGGHGDAVSDYVDFDPWSSWPVGVEERPITKRFKSDKTLTATIFTGSLRLPDGKQCRVFDITGRVVEPSMITRGIYFLEINGEVVQKVIKIK